MTAVGKALSASDKASDDVLLIIQKGCTESSLGIRQAAWIAFGRSGASAEDHLALIQSKASGVAAAEEDPADALDEDSDPVGEASAEEPASDDLIDDF
jgi:hypothetical protein